MIIAKCSLCGKIVKDEEIHTFYFGDCITPKRLNEIKMCKACCDRASEVLYSLLEMRGTRHEK